MPYTDFIYVMYAESAFFLAYVYTHPSELLTDSGSALW